MTQQTETIEQYISRLKALEAKATPGPWEPKVFLGIKNGNYVECRHFYGKETSKGGLVITSYDNEKDNIFIAESRTAIPKLVKILECLLDRLDAHAPKDKFRHSDRCGCWRCEVKDILKEAI